MALTDASHFSKTLGLTSSAHRKRYREVISILSKYGFEEFLLSSHGQKVSFLHRHKHIPSEFARLSRPKRIKLAIEELDGAFIKFAQILSNRPDILPAEYIAEFESLQDSLPPFSTAEAITVIETELQDSLQTLFLMFDDEPLASGSIAQVHRAVLFDGTPVVIKVRRPGIEDKFRIDIDVLNYLSTQVAKFSALKSQFKTTNPVRELSAELFKELDFSNELANIQKFAANFTGNTDLYVPRVYPSFSTKQVLTMEYVQGIKVTHHTQYQKLGIDPVVIANKLVDLGLIQLFDHRFFHGDPHPGNILVMSDGKICFLDFGLVGTISSRQRQTIIDLISAFARNDAKKITRIMVAFAPKDLYIDETNLEDTISGLLDKYFDTNLQEVNVGKALSEVMSLVLEYRIRLSFTSYLLLKALSSYEGIGKKIYPEFELAPPAKKFAEKLIKEQLAPTKIVKDAYFSVTDTISLLRDLPRETKEILELVQGGGLRFNIGILDLKDTVDYAFDKSDKIVNRLVIAIILAAIIMGSSIILGLAKNINPQLVYLTAALGFIFAIVLAFFILFSIIRHKGI